PLRVAIICPHRCCCLLSVCLSACCVPPLASHAIIIMDSLQLKRVESTTTNTNNNNSSRGHCAHHCTRTPLYGSRLSPGAPLLLRSPVSTRPPCSQPFTSPLHSYRLPVHHQPLSSLDLITCHLSRERALLSRFAILCRPDEPPDTH